jgi:ADP-ribose pyrophosphatase
MSNSGKPQGSKLGWQVLETAYPFENEIYKLRNDRIQVEGRGETSYAYLERADAIIVVPVTNDGQIILLRQYRYPVDEWCWEVPAGGSHDTGDVPLEEVVRKEMEEEIGATCAKIEHINFFYSSNSMSDEKCHVYLALGVELKQKPHTEETENIEMHPMPAAEAIRLARSGQIKTAPCALALLLCEDALREHGYL